MWSVAMCWAARAMRLLCVIERWWSLRRGSGLVQLCLQRRSPKARVLLVMRQGLDGDVVAFGGFAQGADGGLFTADMGERIPGIPAPGVLGGHIVDLVIGHIVLGEPLGQLLGRAGPHRIGVRVVGLPADVVTTDLVAQLDPHRV